MNNDYEYLIKNVFNFCHDRLIRKTRMPDKKSSPETFIICRGSGDIIIVFFFGKRIT